MNQPALHEAVSLADELRAIMRSPSGCRTCAWCGSTDVTRRTLTEWPPRVVVTCSRCGSELVADRRLAKAGSA
jgi:RNase P subunit RPR2